MAPPLTAHVRFNKIREDFNDLRQYNDYLEEVEDIGKNCIQSCRSAFDETTAFNLIHEIDIPETEARILAYRAENAAFIELNIQREEQYAHALKEQEDAERRDREQRALEARREEEEEREERERGHRDIIDGLETSDKDASKVIARSRAAALKRSSARNASSSTASQSTSYAQLLRSRAAQSAVVPDVPHVTLQDDWYAYEDMYILRGVYQDSTSEAVRRDRDGIMRAGGYRVEEAWDRALRSAVGGLDVPPLIGLDNDAGDVSMASA